MITEPSWRGIADKGRPRIGYAAFCHRVSSCGNSAVANCLREGLEKVADVVDIWPVLGVRVPESECDVILAMECAGLIPEPYFIYLCPEQVEVAPMEPAVYKRAAGLFADNARLAQWLTESMGVSREKIHVISPAALRGRHSARILPSHMREAPRRRLLLCLSDGSSRPDDEPVRLVLDALDILRRDYDPQIGLTVVGLEKWRSSSSPQDGVTFLASPLAQDEVELFDSHDVLVLPPGAECRGLPEAFSVGIPCVATSASEMSDAITPGLTGAVIDDVNARELAAAIASVLGNDSIYHSCLERAPAMAAYFSWERVARQVNYVISREVGLLSE